MGTAARQQNLLLQGAALPMFQIRCFLCQWLPLRTLQRSAF